MSVVNPVVQYTVAINPHICVCSEPQTEQQHFVYLCVLCSCLFYVFLLLLIFSTLNKGPKQSSNLM